MYAIKKISIENFKSYGHTADLPLKHINFLFGPNSHGKSTALTALYILGNHFLQRNFSLSKISHIDNSPDIILRDDLVNYSSKSNSFSISCELEVGDTFSRVLGVDDNEVLLIPTFELEDLNMGKLKKFSVYERFNDETALFYEITDDLIKINFDSKYYRDSIREVDHMKSEIREGKPLREGIHEFQGIPIDWSNLKVDTGSIYLDPRWDKELGAMVIDRKSNLNENDTEIAHFLNKQLNTVFDSFEIALFNEGIGWIGPNRSVQNESFTINQEKGFIEDRFLTNDAVNTFNSWLRRTESINLDYEFVLDIDKTRAGVTKKEYGLKDLRTGKYLTLYEVGSGVAHLFQILLPFFSVMHGFIIQQPEIHLHPSMQVQLTKALIELSWKFELKPKIIIETHSEHIIKAAQLEIARSLNSNDSYLNKDLVSVLYISKDKNGFSNAKQIELDETGAFTEPWPDDFFEISADLSLERLRNSIKSRN